mmetsp:Transcript_13204/g.41675  ORF Transcript_13204/g.41675 Transcript_13204/m.41675 type:complete len:201 (+) Transcript_13204:260-862(+)
MLVVNRCVELASIHELLQGSVHSIRWGRTDVVADRCKGHALGLALALRLDEFEDCLPEGRAREGLLGGSRTAHLNCSRDRRDDLLRRDVCLSSCLLLRCGRRGLRMAFLQLQRGIGSLDHVIADLVGRRHEGQPRGRKVHLRGRSDGPEDAYIAPRCQGVEAAGRAVAHIVARLDATGPVVQGELNARRLPRHRLDDTHE